MLERFTERARMVVVLAQDEARAFRHPHLGTEHLLLGLMREEEGPAARVLDSLDITVEEVRADVRRVLGVGEELHAVITFTPRAKSALEAALTESRDLGSEHVETEHLLLGLLNDDESIAARILLQYGADRETVRNALHGV